MHCGGRVQGRKGIYTYRSFYTYNVFLPSRRDNRFYKDIKALHGLKKHDDEP